MNFKVQLVIPLAGDGKRFQERYSCPKPLINIRGERMISLAFRTLSISHNKAVFIIRKDHDIDGILTDTIQKITSCVRIINIDSLTDGPCCTALLAKPHIDSELPLVIANCDQVMRWSGDKFIRFCQMENYDGAVVTYHENTPKNSYARLNSYGEVMEIREKEQISCVSLNGIHYWKKAKYFFESASKMIMNDERTNNEFYIAPTYNYMIKDGLKVGVFHIPNEQHCAIGVPNDLDKYIQISNKEES
jgi:dTDP-glucose pyrophosphorylase